MKFIPHGFYISDRIRHYSEAITRDFSHEEVPLIFSKSRANSSPRSFKLDKDGESVVSATDDIRYPRGRRSTSVAHGLRVKLRFGFDNVDIESFLFAPDKDFFLDLFFRFFVRPLRAGFLRLLSFIESFNRFLHSLFMIHEVSV